MDRGQKMLEMRTAQQRPVDSLQAPERSQAPERILASWFLHARPEAQSNLRGHIPVCPLQIRFCTRAFSILRFSENRHRFVEFQLSNGVAALAGLLAHIDRVLCGISSAGLACRKRTACAKQKHRHQQGNLPDKTFHHNTSCDQLLLSIVYYLLYGYFSKDSTLNWDIRGNFAMRAQQNT